MSVPRVVLVAAVARNGVIGAGNRMAWRLPEDLRHLRNLTMGAPVIMGRSTWDSLPDRFRPLPGRRNVVLTRRADWGTTGEGAGAQVAHSLAEALASAGDVPRVFVIGGAQVYAEAMPIADELVLTEIDHDFEGDTFFPPLPAEFVETARMSQRAAPPNDYDFSFVTYQRERAGAKGD